MCLGKRPLRQETCIDESADASLGLAKMFLHCHTQVVASAAAKTRRCMMRSPKVETKRVAKAATKIDAAAAAPSKPSSVHKRDVRKAGIWKTKFGPRRVRHDPPTLEEAIIAATGLTDDA